ncbi:MAG: apolipoprotein N-acyltransferase [Planctomycetota bacterium]|nr:apolipoprotein N-acyltransferase [Planctomycetota bacterium]
MRTSTPKGAETAEACLSPEACAHGAVKTIIFALLHAVLFVCAYPPVNAWPLALLSPAPLAWLAINARSTRRALLVVLIVQILMWLWMKRWLIEVTVVGYPLLALYMSLYALLFVWIIRRLSRQRLMRAQPLALIIALVWVGLECLRGELIFDGYPWFLLGHPLIEWPLLGQSADLLGAYFTSFLAAAVAGVAVDFLRWHARRLAGRPMIVAVVVVALLQILSVGYGVRRLRETPSSGDELRILAIQTNLPQSNKIAWGLEDQRTDMAAWTDLTRRAFEEVEAPPDLIAWPETMLPARGLEPDILQALLDWRQQSELGFALDVIRLSDELDTPMLIGAPTYLGLDVNAEGYWTWETHYNSAYLVEGMPPYQRYDKCFLTPFGEVMPYISAWPWLEEKLLAVGAPGMTFDLAANPDIEHLELKRADDVVVLATPICFEDTMARVCRRMVYERGVKRADVLVNLSNDGWFGSHESGRVQHAQIARFRCIENRVPMVRCVNTGVSVSIDAAGRLLGRIGEGRYGEARQEHWLEAVATLDGRATVYGRIGDLWAWVCLLLTAGLTGAGFLRPRSQRKGKA